MKPNFALDFRNDAITLLHRTSGEWQPVGEARLDDADLPGALARMRADAEALSPKSLTTKLVIPNGQILYTQVPVTAQDAGRRRKQVARALEGVTPYAVADLAFDISGTGPVVDVAVIAKETLAEAEAFATEHGFNPVSFVAVPEAGGFAAEPWFGPAVGAASHLAEGQRVERDNALVVIAGREPEPVPAPVEAAAAIDADPQPDAPGAEPALPAVAQAEPATPEAALAEPAQAEVPDPAATLPEGVAAAASSTAAGPASDLPAADLPAADLPAADRHAEPFPEPPRLASEVPEDTAPDTIQPDTIPPGQPVTPPANGAADLEPEEVLARMFEDEGSTPPTAAGSPPDEAPPQPLAAPAPPLDAAPVNEPPVNEPPLDEAPMALDVVEDAEALRDAPAEDRLVPPRMVVGVLNPTIADDLPPPPSPSVMVAFGSRRALEASAKEAAAKAGAPRADIAPRASGKAPALGNVSASRTQAKVTTLPPRPAQPSVVRLPPRPGASQGASLGTSTGSNRPDARDAPPRPVVKPSVKTSAAGKALRGLGALVTSPGIAGAKERRPPAQVVTPPAGPTSAAAAAAATLTKPAAKPYSGGLGNRSLDRPRPRYLGLILTGILLVFLLLVAAWSTLFLETRDTTTPDPNAVVGADLPAVEDEMAADLQGLDPAEAPPTPEALAAAPPPAPHTAPDTEAAAIADAVAAAAPVAEAPAEPAPIAPLDTEAATAATPLVANPQDEFLLATMDAPPAIPDALSLPQPEALNDAPPGPAVPPPPFGTVYQFDAAGLIVPTPEGILSPEGVLLFAGRPSLVPPPRPASLAPASLAPATDPVAATPVPEATAVPPDAAAAAFPADPGLAGARPRPRPATLTPPTQNADDDASLAPADGSRFASLRPRAKPAELAATAAAAAATAEPDTAIAALGAQAASLTAQANATAAVATGSQSALILAVSRRPAPRPTDMSAAVEAAVAVASRQPDPTLQIQEPVKEPVQQPSARTEPEADDEPEVTTAMPRLPTKTTVAKQATYVNAINLSKVNLIGIYGSASDRYALIRQPNGRYKKVKVGDSFDGGRVAAITTSEVRYQKSGKMVTLALPKG